jgi:uncharacterized phage-associated protein
MNHINDITDYIIFRLNSDESVELSNLKLQKLLYYTQAWCLAFHGETIFDGKFQAWIHGPVNRDIYDRFKEKKYLYSPIKQEDVLNSNVVSELPEKVTNHIDNILEAYAPFTATQLEIMTHREDPWVLARKGYLPTQRCEEVIDEKIMEDYYKKRLEK